MAAALAYVTQQTNEVESIVIGDGPGIAPSTNGSIINKMVDFELLARHHEDCWGRGVCPRCAPALPFELCSESGVRHLTTISAKRRPASKRGQTIDHHLHQVDAPFDAPGWPSSFVELLSWYFSWLTIDLSVPWDAPGSTSG